MVVRTSLHGIFICSKRSARNMAYQGFFAKSNDHNVPSISEIAGIELINCVVSSNLSFYKKFRVLPLLSIKEDKGTGVVTSVPAEAPDDFVAFQDVKNNKTLCDKYKIDCNYLKDIEPVSISITNFVFIYFI